MEKIVDAGPGLMLAWVDIGEAKEQDVNPNVMEPTMFGQLTMNVSKRGALESVPLLAIPKDTDTLEIVSGHKRMKAAREAGLDRIIALVDTSGLSRSAVAAKVIAHNTIDGYDDKQLLAELAQQITDIEDRLEAFLPDDIDEPPAEPLDSLLSPKVTFDWKTVTVAFLPDELDSFNELIDAMPNAQDLVAVADVALFDEFGKALSGIGRVRDVKSANQAVALMVKVALSVVNEADDQLGDGEYIHLSEVIGNVRVPRDMAESLQDLRDAYDIEKRDGHQLMELLIAALQATMQSAT